MTSTTVKEYRGYLIELTTEGVFFALDKDKHEMAKSDTLKGVEKQLDKMSKGVYGQTIYVNLYDHYSGMHKLGEYRKAKLTSIKAKARYGNTHEFRVSIEGGSWREVEAREIVKDTEENRRILGEITGLHIELKAIEDKIKERVEKLQKYTEKELTGEESE